MSIYLKVQNLEKKINNKEILKNISFEVEEGKIVGLLGPNGAGKTTTIHVIAGLVKASGGVIEVFGMNPWKEKKLIGKNVGVLIEPAFVSYLTAFENLCLLGKYNKIETKYILKVLEFVGLEKTQKKKIDEFSLGMTQRLGLAQALMCKPKLIILDEPMIGLDPNGIENLKNKMRYLSKNEGVSILFSSHQLFEIEDICDEIVIIDKGETKFRGNRESVNKQVGYKIRPDNMSKSKIILKQNGINYIENGELIEVIGNKLENIIEILYINKIRIKHVEPTRNSLIEIFNSYTEGK